MEKVKVIKCKTCGTYYKFTDVFPQCIYCHQDEIEIVNIEDWKLDYKYAVEFI